MKIRDFIYLDNDLLYSLYSQVFEGVVEAVTDSYAAEKTTTDKQRKLDAKVAEASIRVENKILYDHMYNKLEERLQKCIRDLSDVEDISLEDFRNDFIVKIQGRAIIHDYSRLRDYTENFNKLGEAVAYSILMSNTNTDISKNGVTRYAKEHALHVDERILENAKLMIDNFHNQSYEINICSKNNPRLLYKGTINRNWLRMIPTNIRELYSDTPMMDWTMVGRITSIPKLMNAPETPTGDFENTIGDSYTNVFDACRAMEDTFTTSNKYKKVHIAPVAIYIETEIDDID
ncbi:MAG: hypothetical protein J1F01_02465 [Oscillospiraceae bacterium]|nr:hypothetical protein [Oscillospiraceae bacterium]